MLTPGFARKKSGKNGQTVVLSCDPQRTGDWPSLDIPFPLQIPRQSNKNLQNNSKMKFLATLEKKNSRHFITYMPVVRNKSFFVGEKIPSARENGFLRMVYLTNCESISTSFSPKRYAIGYFFLSC